MRIPFYDTESLAKTQRVHLIVRRINTVSPILKDRLRRKCNTG